MTYEAKSAITLELRAEAEAKALADFNAAVGREITARMISGYNGNDDSVDVDGISIRVTVDNTPFSLNPARCSHWVDEYLDPYWDVTPIGDYPELAGLRSFWTFGPSYRVVDGKVEAVDNNQSVLRSELPRICPICEKAIGDEWNKCLCLHETENDSH